MTHEDVESEFENDSDIDHEDPSPKRPERPDRRQRKPAREKIMDLIARRDHSELELKRKLAVHYEQDEVENAIEFARENNWLKAPEELAETVSRQLNQRNKGSRYIQRFLRTKGLPNVRTDSEVEREKALDLLKTKLDLEPPFAYEDQRRITRLLTNRGFDYETIRKIIHEKP